LHALHILDTEPDARFDALTRLAAQAAGTRMAAIGLMDAERLWFKARTGDLPAQLLLRDLPPTLLAAMGSATLLRLAPHPERQALWPARPELCLLGTAPIVSPEGLLMGCVIVLDTQPQPPSAQLRHTLDDLALQAAALLQNHQRGHKLEAMAMSDALTGLGNRAAFDQALAGELGHAMRRGEPFTVLLLDLDGFKAINDGFGHAAGDEVLTEVGQRLRQQVRLGDALSRLGGDEFGIVMRHGHQTDAQALARRIVKAVSAPIRLSSGDEVGVGVSLGLAAYDDTTASARALLSRAGQALFEAKRQNEKRWKMFVGERG
jgi:diguanylate cyclase (GGDEF)-like protein